MTQNRRDFLSLAGRIGISLPMLEPLLHSGILQAQPSGDGAHDPFLLNRAGRQQAEIGRAHV